MYLFSNLKSSYNGLHPAPQALTQYILAGSPSGYDIRTLKKKNPEDSLSEHG